MKIYENLHLLSIVHDLPRRAFGWALLLPFVISSSIGALNNAKNTRHSLDFSKFSDAVLAMEKDGFHVNRNILGMWSQVFTMMFAAGTACHFPLPGMKSAEIKEMLLVIKYPTSGKPIDQTNQAFLLDLAREYMMTKLTKKCERYLIISLETEAS